MKRSMLLVLAGFGLASMLIALVAYVGEKNNKSLNAQTQDYAILHFESGADKTDVIITTASGTEIKKIKTSDLNGTRYTEMISLNKQGFELVSSSHTVDPGYRQTAQYVFIKGM